MQLNWIKFSGRIRTRNFPSWNRHPHASKRKSSICSELHTFKRDVNRGKRFTGREGRVKYFWKPRLASLFIRIYRVCSARFRLNEITLLKVRLPWISHFHNGVKTPLKSKLYNSVISVLRSTARVWRTYCHGWMQRKMTEIAKPISKPYSLEWQEPFSLFTIFKVKRYARWKVVHSFLV